MAFNSKTYHTNKQRRTAYATLERARSEKASPYCDPKRVAFLARCARSEMRMHLVMRGESVGYYSIRGHS